MTKWKCEICGDGFDNFQAQGFDNLIYCPLCYFKKKYADEKVENDKLQKRLSKKEKELDSYKRLIENLKKLWLGTEEFDYDYEENPITNFEPFDFDYYVDNWFECEELEEKE